MIIVKIGGGKGINISGIVKDLAELKEKFIIVHGANALRDKLCEDLGQPKQVLTSVKGYTSVYSDEKLLDVMMMAYAGLRNKRIVESCHQYGINAVGLTGLDGKLVRGRRNKGIRVYQDGKLRIVRDFSGKPEEVNKPLLELLLENGYVPVLTVPIIDEQDAAINTENDDVVRVL
ncbi:MAG: acetylglutamate kinase, partial [Deltaproteobacteria bacterium]|nr:acetylglutamate kinase [Deltaproteobacteria bacterium]